MRGPVGENGHVSSSRNANGSGATEDPTTELSRLMLEGWTMMAETCPRSDCYIPLARSREGLLYCCGCRSNISAVPEDNVNDTASASNSNNNAEPTEDPLTDETNSNTPNADTGRGGGSNSIVAIRGGTDTGSELSVSTALGEKLLQGWTLLNTTCQICNTPLLRAQSGTLLCVQCATDGAAAAAASATPASTPALPAPQARPSLPPPGDNRTESIMPAPAGTRGNNSNNNARSNEHGYDHAREGTRESTLHTTDDATYLELVRSEEAVVYSMREMRSALASRRDVDGKAAIICSLGDAARTIEALRSTRKGLGNIM